MNINSISNIDNIDNNGQADLLIDVVYDKKNYNLNGENKTLPFPSIRNVEISESKKIQNSIKCLEGELVIEKSLKVDCLIDDYGDLYISDKKSNLDCYELNENDELIFKFKRCL